MGYVHVRKMDGREIVQAPEGKNSTTSQEHGLLLPGAQRTIRIDQEPSRKRMGVLDSPKISLRGKATDPKRKKLK